MRCNITVGKVTCLFVMNEYQFYEPSNITSHPIQGSF